MPPLSFFAALFGFVGVALGAFGAHGLKGQFTPQAEAWWDTGTFYLLIHAVAALVIGLTGRKDEVLAGGWAMIIGSAIFSSTLYFLALGAPRWFGAITPIGGLALLAGWALVLVGVLRSA
ncbi:DUF423 domain-containing protein [Henriciella mobilis]|uniref:DUF423 domain-containing protein n=1 Tax=Henriciella mobilis TaxID=2305467 RepID=A0A399RA66_9PROT|nr:DUF423 domain-containing protein [Henriciella mobilis]RIJ28330.1 DUF423 domain-containing protein [Henriciella mobilis]